MADDAQLPVPTDNAGLRALARNVHLNAGALQPRSLAEIMDFAQLMAKSGPMVGKAFRGNPGACAGITMQALQWNMSPYAVSQKAFVTVDKFGNEVIGYESQLVNAVINAHAPIKSPLEYDYEGEGPERQCIITGMLKTATKPSIYRSPPLKQCAARSPLWQSDPDQQLGYYASRAWARRYCPEIMMGVYTPEELQNAEPMTVTDSVAIDDQRPPEEIAESVGDAFIMGEAAELVEKHYTALFANAATVEEIEKQWKSFNRKYWTGKRRCVSQLFYDGIDALKENAMLRLETGDTAFATVKKALEKAPDLDTLEQAWAASESRIAKMTDAQQTEVTSLYETRGEAFADELHAKLAAERNGS